jgi:hypothetical protein
MKTEIIIKEYWVMAEYSNNYQKIFWKEQDWGPSQTEDPVFNS